MNLQRHDTTRIRTPHARGGISRRSGREGGQALTVGFRRYVEAVLSPDHTLAKDLEAALNLAEDLMAYERGPETDAALIADYGQVMRQTATAVRQAGRSAVAHPALLARAIVLARTLDRTAAVRRPTNGDRVLQPA